MLRPLLLDLALLRFLLRFLLLYVARLLPLDRVEYERLRLFRVEVLLPLFLLDE